MRAQHCARRPPRRSILLFASVLAATVLPVAGVAAEASSRGTDNVATAKSSQVGGAAVEAMDTSVEPPEVVRASRALREGRSGAGAYICCDGAGGFTICSGRLAERAGLRGCQLHHESDHIDWYRENLPGACVGRAEGEPEFRMTQLQFRQLECSGYAAEVGCLTRAAQGQNGRILAQLSRRQHQLRTAAEVRFSCSDLDSEEGPRRIAEALGGSE